MPRPISLGQFKKGSLRLVDLAGSQFASGSDLVDLINEARCEVHALLSRASPPDYDAESFQISTTSGTYIYQIGSYVQDFGWLRGVYALESSDGTGVSVRIPLRAVQDRERSMFGAPGGICTVEIEYTPLPENLTDDNDTDDGLFGYEGLVYGLVARELAMKQRQDFGGIQTKIDEIRARILTEATNRDKGQPRYMNDEANYGRRGYIPSSAAIRGYRLRGDTIELYQPSLQAG